MRLLYTFISVHIISSSTTESPSTESNLTSTLSLSDDQTIQNNSIESSFNSTTNVTEAKITNEESTSKNLTNSDPTESCQDICNGVEECIVKGSYCKLALDGNNVCQGLYFRDIGRTDPCSADDPTCPEAIPVRCPNSPEPNPSVVTCENICSLTGACAFSPTHQGTYCKTEQIIPTCFGLFWRDQQQTIPCYWPVDPSCPQSDPVRCG